MVSDNTPYSVKVHSLFKNGLSRTYPKNQIIFYQGDPLSSICLVEKGYIKAYTILDSGDNRSLFLLGPGDIFPVAFSLSLDWSEYKVRYFYQSLTDVELSLIDGEYFKRTIDSSGELMNVYLTYMAATNEAIISQLEMMKTKGAINKVASLLPYLVQKIGRQRKDGTCALDFKLSHQEIADLTGLTRETTTQQIKILEQDGIIKQKRGTWIIKLEEAKD